MQRSTVRGVGAVALLMATSVVAAGCGGSSPGAEASASTQATDPQAAMADFRSCLQEQGVELPDRGGPPGSGDAAGGPAGGPPPGGGPGGQDGPPPDGGPGGPGGDVGFTEEQRKAMEACRDELPQGGTPPRMTDEQRAAMEQQRTKLTACLKQAGVTLPQGGRGSGPEGEPGGGEQQLDAKSQQAFAACREEVGAPAGPGAAPPDGGAPPRQ